MKLSKHANPRVSDTTTIQAPTGGLNSQAALTNMPPQDAIVLRNLFPQPYGCKLRRGFQKYSLIPGGATVETLMNYSSKLGTEKLFSVATDGVLYDSTVAGNAVATSITGLTNARFQHLVFANAAGNFLLAANGLDDWIKYDGTALSRVTSSDITGVDPKQIISLEVHQRRLWMVQVNTTKGWYLAPDAISGAATAFDFGPLFRRGGFLQAIVAWTIDSGEGSEDRLCAISSKGEVAVYSGTDPSTLATWQLDGVYFVGAPVGRRCAKKISGDINIINQYGLSSLAEAVVSTKLNNQNSGIAGKIQNLVSAGVSNFPGEFGWEIFLNPADNMYILNCPLAMGRGDAIVTFAISPVVRSNQLAMNTITQGWCTFTEIPALCWALFLEAPFFGAPGYVGKFMTGFADGADNLGIGGNPVIGEALQAFNYFGNPGRQKYASMIRPVFVSQGDISWAAEVRVDFDLSDAPAPSSNPVGPLQSYWDVSLWDAAYWAGTLNTYQRWTSASGIGFACTISLSITANADVYWTSTDWLFQAGGIF